MTTPKLNTKERAILKVLFEVRRPLTIGKVAEISGLSWNTVEKYIKKFHTLGWIIKYQKKKREYYSAHKFT